MQSLNAKFHKGNGVTVTDIVAVTAPQGRAAREKGKNHFEMLVIQYADAEVARTLSKGRYYANADVPGAIRATQGHSFKVDEEEVIIVNVPSYLEKFSKYIQQTPDRVQANYMLWRAAAASMKYLTEDARKISLKFLKKLTGKTEETSR